MSQAKKSRERMVARQLELRGIRDPLVLSAMRQVPREAFVPERTRELAYEDCPLPIGEGQTISQPYIVAAMLEAAELTTRDHVLDVGTGSGYAAAVTAAIVKSVHTIERLPGLAREARETLARLEIKNVHVHVGDGTLGLPDEAPFDAILVAAGGPAVPYALRDQLAIGGRLVMPIGDERREQRLVKVTRRSRTKFEEENLGDVRFVPLIGELGWQNDDIDPDDDEAPPRATAIRSLTDLLRDAAEPLPELDDERFGACFDRFANRRVVLLGEASHGTSEFYRARAAITRRLIERHGFEIVAVEADWPDAATIDRFVRGRPARSTGAAFERFPRWMWRNTEFAAFTKWLRAHNAQRDARTMTSFYGLDLYNMSGSIAAVLRYLDEVDPDAARVARERYACLTPFQNDTAAYGHAVLTRLYDGCDRAVLAQLKSLLEKELEYTRNDGELFLDATQNARVVAAAERFYKEMYFGASESWNLRDTHMFETLMHVLDARGPRAKAIVWAHNSHIGDASATEMGTVRAQLNIGQLCRERFGNDAALIGFGTDHGTVAAASTWDGPLEIKHVRHAREDSYESLAHRASVPSFLLDLREGVHVALREGLISPRLERFIGVIYRPETELASHYSGASLPRQFDAYVWFDETTAVTPLEGNAIHEGLPDTYPFGL